MNLTKPQLIAIVFVLVIVLIFGLIFLGVVPGLKNKKNDITQIRANLEVWVINDKASNYEKAISDFNSLYPNVSVNIRVFDNELNYKKTILEALAAGSGPDIFMIENGTLLKEINKLTPINSMRYSLLSLRQNFPQVVEQDFVYQNQIYALPLSIDTLALFYNRSLFNQAGIVLPPTTWEEFENLIPRLVKQDESKKIIQAAAAIGGSQKNIERASDILALLMLQKNSAVTQVDWAGIEALSFYTKFANAANPLYTWSSLLPKAFNLFTQEKVAMIFEYASAVSLLKNQNPFLNFVVSPAPQFSQSQKAVAYPRYFGYAVAKKSRYPWLAWDFVINLTTKPANAKAYLEQAGLPPALNILINEKLNDPEMNVFAKQALLAKSWSKIDSQEANNILSEAIEFVISGWSSPERALRQLQQRFEQLNKTVL
jgi:multiple sugar transport system substrate-binding protein